MTIFAQHLPRPLGRCCVLNEHADSEEKTEEEDVASSLTEDAVEVATIKGAHLAVGMDVEKEVGEKKKGGEGMNGEDSEKCGDDAEPEIDGTGNALTNHLTFCCHDADNDGTLAADFVLMTVTVVIHHEKVVSGKPHGEGCEEDGELRV